MVTEYPCDRVTGASITGISLISAEQSSGVENFTVTLFSDVRK